MGQNYSIEQQEFDQSESSLRVEMTLDGKKILKEGWLTFFKSRKPGLFSSKPLPNKPLDRAWAVLYQFSSKGPVIAFFQDNRKEVRVMKKEKLELFAVKEVTRMLGHPKHPHCFTMKSKGNKRVLLNADTNHDVEMWLKVVGDVAQLSYKQEKVIWEYLDDGGLWQALSNEDCYKIEAHFCEQSHSFHLGDAQLAFQYNLNNMTRSHPRTKHHHRLKRTLFIEEQPEVLHKKMMDLSAIWEWGDGSKEEWHPFERDTNIQIEDMYDSGSQWAELTLCLPSPMPFLLDLHDMKLVNFRTAVRHSLRRLDNSDNLQEVSRYPEARSPSPDDFEEVPFQEMSVSPLSPIFKSLQATLEYLQVQRTNLSYKQMIGEGAFGEVHLAEAVGLPGYGDKKVEVAVKQLRLSDFIARHGQHSQQMEDFLREAKEMSKVNHHRVVKLIAVCTLDYPLLLIEEYMNQGDLLGVLKDSRPHMPLVTQLMFAYHVADGMDYLSRDINTVHRDLAARNILVQKHQDDSMVAKVADFGLSRHLYSDMYKHQGTKPRPLPAKWMALESLMYFIFTTKSDVWAFGVLMWEIMTLGRAPYPGVENRELLEQIEEKGLKLNKPRPCLDVIYEMILDCTQHDPEERPPFSDLRDKLLAYYKEAEEGKLVCDDDGGSLPTSPTSKEMPLRESPSTEGTSQSENKEGGDSPSQAKGEPPSQAKGEPPSQPKGDSPSQAKGDSPSQAKGDSPSQAKGEPPSQAKGDSPSQAKGEPPSQAKGEPPSQAKRDSPSQAAGYLEPKPRPNKLPKLKPTRRAPPPPKKHPRATPTKLNLPSSSKKPEEKSRKSPNRDLPPKPEAVPEATTTSSLAPQPQSIPIKESFTEVTPQGHVYYLLDPLEDPLDPDDVLLDIRDSQVSNHTHSIPRSNSDGTKNFIKPEVKGTPPSRRRGTSPMKSKNDTKTSSYI